MVSYLVFLSHSAKAATAPASDVACISYDVANVSGHVTSQTSERPDFQGAIVTPSGRLPSECDRPAGSKIIQVEYFFTCTLLFITYCTYLHLATTLT